MNNEELEQDINEEVSDSVEDETEKEIETFTYTIDNNNINNDYNKGNNNDNKSLIYIVIGVFILIFIIGMLIYFANGKSKVSGYSDIESSMVKGAKGYYEKNSNLLPVMDNNSVTVSAETLIEESLLKPFSEMVEDDISCTGYVNVFKSNDEYVYFPYLNCSDYESLRLSQKIIDSGIVNSGDGLYQINDTYIYRGEYPNNYVKFDDNIWRIISVNSNGSIKMILTERKIEKNVWDDRYNSSRDSYVGINDFRVSRLLEYLNELYENNTYVSKKNKDLLVKHDWCIGKISEEDTSISSLNLCSDIYSDLYIGVVQVDDILTPSIDPNCNNLYDIECTNYNYFFTINTGWTLNASSDRSYVVFNSNGGAISHKNASVDSYIRPVINVNSNILYKNGNGTFDDPYVIGE